MVKKVPFNFRKADAGFSLIELMVAIAIASIAFTIGIARYRDFNRNQTLKSAAQTVKNNLRHIQAQAKSGVKPINCGSNFNGYLVLYSSPTSYQSQVSCTGFDPTITTYTLPENIQIWFSAASFRFNNVEGGIFPASDVILEIRSTQTLNYIDLTVSPSGDIEEGSITCCYTPPL